MCSWKYWALTGGLFFLCTGQLVAGRIVVFRSVVVEKGDTVVSVRDADGPTAWVRVGGVFSGNRVVALSTDLKRLDIIDERGQQYSVPLEQSVIFGQPTVTTGIRRLVGDSARPKSPGQDAAVEIFEAYPPKGSLRSNQGLDWDFIKSSRNPLRDRPDSVLKEYSKVSDWLLLPPQRKQALIEQLRQHGWHLQVVASSEGLSFLGRRASPTDPNEVIYPEIK